jgi:deazaflavin-dependent oxidoreductase (nitroreductase family)
MSDSTNDSASMANDINAFNRALIEEFRANNGKVSGMFAQAPLVLVTHTGAKSGQQRTSPLVYSRDGDRIVIIASKAGAPTHPHWYLNMVANPQVTVELPGETYAARAVITSGAERERLYRAQADQMPNFDEYAAKTTREIPVVVLERI